MSGMTEQQIIDQLTQRLAVAYPHLASEQVERTVCEEYGRFDGRPIRDFIPPVCREARHQPPLAARHVLTRQTHSRGLPCMGYDCRAFRGDARREASRRPIPG
ncbi:three-helix bundle dimerization domain-containing protein [Mycolicibacterium aichiense]|uniref:three-helix bundle dimerization domain-containing protein n=1 Tax=Mycolicibacterium aichiense TaxID=1799 RepID=UPI003D67B0DF